MGTKQTKGAALLSVVAMMMVQAQPAAAGAVVNIMGRVPTICRVSLEGGYPLGTEESERPLGTLIELCNNVEGYRLVLVHPAGLQDAAIVLDGERIPIEKEATRTIIVDSNHAAFRGRRMTLLVAEGTEAVPINIEAQPKGIIF